MKLFWYTIVVVVSCLFFGDLSAQQQKRKKDKANRYDKLEKETKPRKLLRPQLYLGHSDFCGGAITRDLFETLLRQGVSAKDSSGNSYQVIGFSFDYYERKMYEDSAANTIFIMDYATEYCFGDTVSANISRSIYDHIKAGDTVVIDRVSLAKQSTTAKIDTILGKGIKCYFVRK